MSYEPYLQRMDFYKQRRFICEITGHSGLTFFEALRSEVCEIPDSGNGEFGEETLLTHK